MRKLVEERTGANEVNKFFKINPKVDDIPDTYSKEVNGVKLLVLGTVETGGGGCVCPEHVMLRRIINNLVIHRDDVVIMDMEAGLEHLGRGTTQSMDQFIVVIEPGARSVQTYKNVKRLADDLGVKQVRVVANKVRNVEDEEFVKAHIPAEDLLGFIHCQPETYPIQLSVEVQFFRQPVVQRCVQRKVSRKQQLSAKNMVLMVW